MEPGALAALATGSSGSSGGGGSSGGCAAAPASMGLRGRLTALHVEIVSEDAPLITATASCASYAPSGAAAAPAAVGTGSNGASGSSAARSASWVGAPLSPATPTGRQAPGPTPKLSAADEMALQGFSRCLESLALIGLEQQLRGCITKPWEPLLAEAAENGPLLAPLKRLALRGCGQIGTAAVAAAADVSSLEQVDFSGSVVSSADVERLARLGGLRGLGVAPLQVGRGLLEALAAGCPLLERLSVGGLMLPGAAATPPTTPGGGWAGGGGGDSAAGGELAALPSVRELQLLGCSGNVGGPHYLPPLLSHAGGLASAPALAAAFPSLSALEIAGTWEVDAAAVAAMSELLSLRNQRLRRLSLHGSCGHPLQAPLLAPLLAAAAPPGAPGLAELELLCVEGLDDAFMSDVAERTKKVRCVFKVLQALTIGGPPPAPCCPIGVPPPSAVVPLLAPPPHASKAAAATGGAAAAATAAAPAAKPAAVATGPPTLSDRGLVKLFGCSKLRRLRLLHLPGISLNGIVALTRGVDVLECLMCVACPAVSAAPRDVAAKAGRLGDHFVRVDVRQ